jgi:hypothetical protein
MMHNVFISYHHRNDQWAKEHLLRMSREHQIFRDWSVDTGDIDPNLPNQRIREIIRDDYLKGSTVTVVLVGQETRDRMHCDWEIKSSMIDGTNNKKSGILVIMLPSTGCTNYRAAHESEKSYLYPETTSWTTISSRAEYEKRYPYLPERLVDNLVKGTAKISVAPWSKIEHDPIAVELLIRNAASARQSNDYCLAREMRKRNHTRSASA